MDSVTKLSTVYNSLCGPIEADSLFIDRENLFLKLAKLLALYGFQWGLCLVHAHCELNPGELMLDANGVCEPVLPPDAATIYPERWLPSGQPYEFTTSQTHSPPDTLLDEFRKLVSDNSVLGLYYAGTPTAEDQPVMLEWTEGRVNKTRVLHADEDVSATIETAWNFSRTKPNQRRCIVRCARDTSMTGGGHLGTKEHLKLE